MGGGSENRCVGRAKETSINYTVVSSWHFNLFLTDNLRSSNQEISHNLRSQRFITVIKRPVTGPYILNQLNPIQTLLCPLTIRSNINLQFMHRSLKWTLRLIYGLKYCPRFQFATFMLHVQYILLFHFITLTISGSDAGGTKTSGSQTSGARDILREVHDFPRRKRIITQNYRK